MATIGSVLAPGQVNALFDLAETQGAISRNRLLDQRRVAGEQDLADRAAWREAAPGLAAGDPAATGRAYAANPSGAASLMGAQQARQLRGYQIDDQEHQLAVRAAAEVMGFPADQRATEYARIVGTHQAQGRLRNAPMAYPGDAHLGAIVQSGLSGQQLYLRQQEGRDRDDLRGRFGFTSQGAGPAAPAGGGVIGPRASADPDDTAARVLIGEAGGQGPQGMAAVAHVMNTRARLGGTSLDAVAMAPNQFEAYGNLATRARLQALPPEQVAQARQLLADAREGRTPDPTNGATNFLNPTLQARLGRPQPSWARGEGQRIGDHVFYSYPDDYARPGRRADAGGAVGRYPGAVDVADASGSGALPADLVAIATGAQPGGGNPGIIANPPGTMRAANPAFLTEPAGRATPTNPAFLLDPTSIRTRTMDPDGLLRDPLPRTGAQLREGGYAADGTDELTAEYAARQPGSAAPVNALLPRRGTLARPQGPLAEPAEVSSPGIRPPMTEEEDRTRGMSPDMQARTAAARPVPGEVPGAAPASAEAPQTAQAPALEVPEVVVTPRRPVAPNRAGVPSISPLARRNALLPEEAGSADRLNGISLALQQGGTVADSPEARTLDAASGTGRFGAPGTMLAGGITREPLAPIGPAANRLMLAGPAGDAGPTGGPAPAPAPNAGPRRNALLALPAPAGGGDLPLPLPPPPAPEPPPMAGPRTNALLPPAAQPMPPVQMAGGDDLPLPPPPAPGDPRDATPAPDETSPRGTPSAPLARSDVISGRGDWREGLTQAQVSQVDALTQGRGVREADVHSAIRQFRSENETTRRTERDFEFRQREAEEGRAFRAEQARLAQDARTDAARARAEAAAAKPGRPLPAGDRTVLAADGGRLSELGTLRGGFSNEFAGYGTAAIGDAANVIARNTPGESPRAEWWGRYQTLKNQVRHSMFGAALTPGEAREFDKADINPGMSHEAVRTALGRQEEIVRGALTRRARSLAADGYSRDAIEELMGIRVDALAQNDAAGAPGQGQARGQQGGASAPPASPRDAQSNVIPPAGSRVTGQTYDTPRGPMIWRGTGWEPAR